MYGMKKTSLKSWEKAPSNQNTRGFEGTGMGDYYGTGVRNPQGKLRSKTVGMTSLNRKQLHTPPKALA